MEIKERPDDSSFSLFLVNNNETPSDAKYDFRGQPQDPYISTWRSPATEFPSEICAILHDGHTDIGACISCNFMP